MSAEAELLLRLERLERRVEQLEARTVGLATFGELTSPTVNFGTLDILREQIVKARIDPKTDKSSI